MTHARSQAELVTIRKLAQEIAAARKERVTSVHLLAAIARGEGPAGEILRERRLDEEALLKASRAFDDDGPDPIGRVLAAARDRPRNRPRPSPARCTSCSRCSPIGRARRTARSCTRASISRASAPRRCTSRSASSRGDRRSPEVATPRDRPRPATLRRTRARRSREGPRGVAASIPRPRRPRRPRIGAARAGRISAGGADLAIAPGVELAVRQPGVAVPLFPPPRLRKPAPSRAPGRWSRPTRSGRGRSSRTRADLGRASLHRSRAPGSRPRARAIVEAPPPSRFALDRALFPVLSALGQNLTLAAAEGTLEPVVGREDEIERALDVLAKRHANSPLPRRARRAWARRAVARGLAHALREGRERPRAACSSRSSSRSSSPAPARAARSPSGSRRSAPRCATAEGRVVAVRRRDARAASARAAVDEANGELQASRSRAASCASSARRRPRSTARSIEVDGALARRFTRRRDRGAGRGGRVPAAPQRRAPASARTTALAYADEAIAAAVAWSIRYLPGRALPDKALSILDLAGARARRKLGASSGARRAVGPPEVASVVAELADVPVERLLETDGERMLALEETPRASASWATARRSRASRACSPQRRGAPRAAPDGIVPARSARPASARRRRRRPSPRRSSTRPTR